MKFYQLISKVFLPCKEYLIHYFLHKNVQNTVLTFIHGSRKLLDNIHKQIYYTKYNVLLNIRYNNNRKQHLLFIKHSIKQALKWRLLYVYGYYYKNFITIF